MSTLLKQDVRPLVDSTKRPWQWVVCPVCQATKIRNHNLMCLACMSDRPPEDLAVYRDEFGEYRRIPLTQGKYMLLDVSKVEELSGFAYYTWCGRQDHILYAARCQKLAKGWRVIFAQNDVMPPPPGKMIDHIDNRDTLNNRICNLRVGDWSLNGGNKSKTIKKTSVYKGVHWRKERSHWVAMISFRGKKTRIGSFHDEAEAARAYNAKAVELFGEFARLNEIE